MWREYHQIFTSEAFKEEWKRLLDSIGLVATPTFYQFISNRYFKELIKENWRVSQTEDAGHSINLMTREEESALHYVAGLVCRKVQTRIQSSLFSNKGYGTTDLSGDEMDDERRTEDWTNAIDCGGLWHVNDDTYMIINIVEEEI